MLPIGDDSGRAAGGGPFSRQGLAIATLTFLAALLVVFACQLLLVPGAFFVPAGLGFVPGALFGGAELPPQLPVIPPPVTLVTYQFLHAGWFHLLGNLLMLLVFGPKVEQAIGPGLWTVLLLVSGIGAALAQAWPDPASSVAMIGASGGLSGILAAYLVLSPRAEVRLLVPVFVVLRVVELPAWIVILAWLAIQVLYASWTDTVPGGVAFRAHVGGFACGLLLAPVLQFLSLLSADARDIAGAPRSRDSGR